MLEEARQRTMRLQQIMKDAGLDVALITDESTIAYLAGFWGYLSVEFGRPSFLIVRAHDAPVVVTPLMESEMVGAMTWVEDVRTWEDAGENRWGRVLANTLRLRPEKARHRAQFHAGDRAQLARRPDEGRRAGDVSPLIAPMRMIKSPLEIEVMKQAGQIAGAMMAAAHGALAEGAPEYEAALAVINAGTRKAAGFLTDNGLGAVRLADDPQPADHAVGP
jgi:Xaa-Pro dipeptidase